MMYLADLDFCASTANIWQIVGYIVMVFKIVIPLLIIAFGMFDLGKAVVASDDKAIKTATSSLIKRVVIGLLIFFIPSIVGLVFGIVENDVKASDRSTCLNCVLHPTDSSQCDASSAWNDPSIGTT